MTDQDKPETLRPEQRPPRKGREETLADRLLAISRDFARRMTPEVRTIDHGTLLYDEHGLPRSD